MNFSISDISQKVKHLFSSQQTITAERDAEIPRVEDYSFTGSQSWASIYSRNKKGSPSIYRVQTGLSSSRLEALVKLMNTIKEETNHQIEIWKFLSHRLREWTISNTNIKQWTRYFSKIMPPALKTIYSESSKFEEWTTVERQMNSHTRCIYFIDVSIQTESYSLTSYAGENNDLRHASLPASNTRREISDSSSGEITSTSLSSEAVPSRYQIISENDEPPEVLFTESIHSGQHDEIPWEILIGSSRNDNRNEPQSTLITDFNRSGQNTELPEELLTGEPSRNTQHDYPIRASNPSISLGRNCNHHADSESPGPRQTRGRLPRRQDTPSFRDRSELRRSRSPHPMDMECPICLEKLKSSRIEFLECAHSFHASCLRLWLKRERTCPVCRTDID